MPGNDVDETRATARLPNLDIDISHRVARDGHAEQLTITLQAVPSFDAFGRFLEANPLQAWMQLMQLAWQPWLMALQMASPALLPKPSRRPASETPEGS